MNNQFTKKCPNCQAEMNYSSKKSLNNAIKNNTLCGDCRKREKLKNTTNFRLCPKCNKQIFYKSPISLDFAKKLTDEGKLCRSCISREAMRGKTVYDTWIKKYGKEEANNKLKEFKLKQSKNMLGQKNPNYGGKYSRFEGAIKWNMENLKGKTFVDSYGEEKANIIKKKISNKTKGKNNPMYGKSSPKRSGNGWSGYYKGNYFRSILELHYLIYLIDSNIKFESGEKRKHVIKYTMNNVERNYFPDFYLIKEDKYVEIKPQNLIYSYQNKLKFEAAKNKLGDKFSILTEKNIVKIDIQKLYNLYINLEIIFDEGYDKKFENYYLKQRKED